MKSRLFSLVLAMMFSGVVEMRCVLYQGYDITPALKAQMIKYNITPAEYLADVESFGDTFTGCNGGLCGAAAFT